MLALHPTNTCKHKHSCTASSPFCACQLILAPQSSALLYLVGILQELLEGLVPLVHNRHLILPRLPSHPRGCGLAHLRHACKRDD